MKGIGIGGTRHTVTDRVEAWIKKTQIVSIGLARSFVRERDHSGPDWRCSRGAAQDNPTISCTPSDAAVDIVPGLRIGVDGDVGNLAIACGIRIGDSGSTLPGRLIPYLAHSPAAGAIFNSAVVPDLLRLIAIARVDAKGGAPYACHIRLRGGVVYRGAGISAGLRVITAGRTQIAACRQNGLTLGGSSLEKDILLLTFVGYARALFTENPASTHHRSAVIDDTRPRVVIGRQGTDRGLIDPQRGETRRQSEHHFHVELDLSGICARGSVVAIDGNGLYLRILPTKT